MTVSILDRVGGSRCYKVHPLFARRPSVPKENTTHPVDALGSYRKRKKADKPHHGRYRSPQTTHPTGATLGIGVGPGDGAEEDGAEDAGALEAVVGDA